MRGDLHLHSVYSDGALAPAELASLAARKGVELFSLTDHDNMEGNAEAAEAARACGLVFVRGWEISAYDGCKIHVLGYGCEAGAAYRDFLAERTRCARLRAREMVDRANAYLGLHVTMSEVESERAKKDAPLHTMHVARAFARRLNRTAGEVYLACFNRGMPAYTAFGRPTPEEAIEVIHACGGIASLAHPGRITLPFGEREAVMERLVRRGLDGIECHYTTHTAEETEYFTAFARRRGLLRTGGSDFHASGGRPKIGEPLFYADDDLLRAVIKR